MTEKQIIDHLAELIVADFDLHRADASDSPSAALVDGIQELCSEKRIVYTAYDGDHLQLSAFMRSSVLCQGKVPANPESILGYKETVTANQVKRGVLLDDLSVLKGCDELWVFTDLSPDEDSIPRIAEGVLVELLYFLQKRSANSVHFVALSDSLRGNTTLRSYPFSFEQTLSLLEKEQAGELVEIATSASGQQCQGRPIAYHIVDPLDFKYSHWLRPQAYSRGTAPLVPAFAVEVRDAWPEQSRGQIVLAWLKLMELADIAWMYPGMDKERGSSRMTKLMEAIWRRQRPTTIVTERFWSEYSIPKATLPEVWALTKRDQIPSRT